MNPRCFLTSSSALGDTCPRNIWGAAYYVPDLVNKNKSFTVLVLRNFIVYHFIWDYKGRTRWVCWGWGGGLVIGQAL